MGGVLCEFPDVFSKSKTGFKFLLLEKFRDSVPEGSAAITSRPHHINAIIAKKVDIISDQYLAADLIYCSTLDLSGLDSLGKGRVFSLFDVVFSFGQMTSHKDTVPLTEFCTPTGFY